jgi:hypothetical protein
MIYQQNRRSDLPFRKWKAPFRGMGRMTQVIVASVTMINTRGIHNYEESRWKELEAKRRKEEKVEQDSNRKSKSESGSILFFVCAFYILVIGVSPLLVDLKNGFCRGVK